MRPKAQIVVSSASLALFVATAATAADLAIEPIPTRWRATFESAEFAPGEHVGLLGVHYDLLHPLDDRQALFAGIGGYGAVSGNRGGFFTVGFSAGWRARLWSRLAVEAGGFAGGGGGGSAAQGGGLMLRPYVALEGDLGVAALRLELDRVEFPNGDIASTDIAVGVTVPISLFTVVPADGVAGPASAVAPGACTRIALTASSYHPDSDTRRRSGGGFTSDIGLVGLRLDRFLDENWYLPLAVSGAVSGGVSGYMCVLGGIGYSLPLSGWLDFEAQLLAGAGGGGGVDTGGGVLVQPMVGLAVHLSAGWAVELTGGRTIATDGGFSATTLGAGLRWQADGVSLSAPPQPQPVLVDGERVAADPWALVTANKTYFPVSSARTTGGGTYAHAIQLLGAGVDKPLGDWLSLTGRAYGAWRGGVGGYAEGLLGLEAHVAPIAAWPGQLITVHGEAGAGGGGGVDVGSGLIWQLTAGWRWQVNGAIGLGLSAGRMDAREGSFAANVVEVELAWSFNRPIWK